MSQISRIVVLVLTYSWLFSIGCSGDTKIYVYENPDDSTNDEGGMNEKEDDEFDGGRKSIGDDKGQGGADAAQTKDSGDQGQTVGKDSAIIGGSGGQSPTTIDGAVITGGGGESGGGGQDRVDFDSCKANLVEMLQTVPRVVLLVDRSSTMVMARFGSYPTRWDALRAALMGSPDGLVLRYESLIRFGFEGYTGFQTGSCPDLLSVSDALNNYEAILPVYDSATPDSSLTIIGQTPTGEALRSVIDKFESQMILSNTEQDPYVILLATDGEPDTCAEPNVDGSPTATQLVVGQVKRAFALGIKTYVLSVGSDVSDSHLQDVANAGVGENDATFFKANDYEGLNDVLTTVISSIVSCRFELNVEIADPIKACEQGYITYDSSIIQCGSQDGWRLVDKSHIELLGSACDSFRTSPTAIVELALPCLITI